MTRPAGRTARRAWRAVLDFLAVQEELHARAAAQARPWEQEFLHWSAAGELHGSLIPPPGRRRSPTPAGCCADAGR